MVWLIWIWRVPAVIREEVCGLSDRFIGVENRQRAPLKVVELTIAEGPAQSQYGSSSEAYNGANDSQQYGNICRFHVNFPPQIIY
jgi:hypothetical protein